jgi:molybdopterin/thiamine biosynthesis adenylyltransferase
LSETSNESWRYRVAFCRNRGLVSEAEQERLRNARVAIAGMGGVGGVHLMTLVRLGIGRFTIVDPDTFEVANFNRQYGALRSTVGRSKTEVMGEMARDVQPELDLRVLPGLLTRENVDEFLDGVDVVVDGLDAFEVDMRRVVFRRAAELGISGLTAGPLGFGTGWIVFVPGGMSFDRYFDLSDDDDETRQFVKLILGVAPRAAHRGYVDFSSVDLVARTAPSVSAGCQLAAGVTGAQVVKLLLGRGPVRAAPWFHQFDPYVGRLVRGRLWGGNRHPLQRLKRWIVERQVRKLIAERGGPGAPTSRT